MESKGNMPANAAGSLIVYNTKSRVTLSQNLTSLFECAPHWLSAPLPMNQCLTTNTTSGARSTTQPPCAVAIGYWMNAHASTRGEFPSGRSFMLEGSRGANSRGPCLRPTPPRCAFGSFQPKRGFLPRHFQNKYCKRQCTWMYNDGHYPLSMFRVFYVLVRKLLFLCNKINVWYTYV